MFKFEYYKIIPLDPMFSFALVEDKTTLFAHPCSKYYLKPSALSINLFISLKWALWGFNFLGSIPLNLLELKIIIIQKIET